MSDPVSEEEHRAIGGLAAVIYGEIASDLRPCHVEDFYDAFYNQLAGAGWRRTVWMADSPALKSAIERVKRHDPAIERAVTEYMRLHYADRRGIL